MWRSPEETARWTRPVGSSLLAGSALAKYPEVFGALEGRADFVQEGPANLAEAVGLLACGYDCDGDAAALEPLYMRRDDAPCTFERFMN